ncbi:MAG: radical SAM protein [Candidatus Omnitrophota bacterium]|nr:radical SAM protein [Candidatus Omnitrophota bacterium]
MKRNHKTDLVRELKNRNIPVEAQWELTNRCNENCIHCLRDKRKVRELTLSEIKDIILQLKGEGCLTLSFSGGEPFLRKDFPKILEFANQHNFRIRILSNGLLIDSKVVKFLKKISRIQFVQISLYGATSQMHDSITRVNGSFKKTMKTIRILDKHKVPFRISAMSFNKNFPELFRMKKMGKKQGWKIIFDFQIFPSFMGSSEPISLRADDEQLRLARKKKLLTWPCDVKPKDRKERTPINLFNFSPCISAEGTVYPSVLLRIKLGSLRRRSFHDIWRNSAKIKWLRNFSEKDFDCYRCMYYNSCCRMPEMAYLEQGDFLVKAKEICRMNKIAQQEK